ncbi:MAG: hypothetical protein JXR88_04855 [Clostridia bacterium]|nr:hypothetical protein [Clostridia bacterium]
MNKRTFGNMISSEEIQLSGYKIENGIFSTTPYTIGIYQKGSNWYVYKTDERGELRLEKEFSNEDEGYDYLIRLISLEKKLENQ